MSTQITENAPKEDPKEGGIQQEPTATKKAPELRKQTPGKRKLRIALIVFAVLVNALVAFTTYKLFTEKRVDPPADQTIAVPYSDQKALLKTWKELPIQHDGRVKPMDSLATDMVLLITGRSKFEKNDPMAVLLSWMMTYDNNPAEVSEPDTARIAKTSKALNANWDDYPFMLCDYHPVRQELYREAGLLKSTEEKPSDPNELKKWEFMMYGKYIEPSIVRRSAEQGSGRYLANIYKVIHGEKKNGQVKPLTHLEQKVKLLVHRISSFDSIRTGKGIGIVDFLKKGPTWFSIYNLKGFEQPSAKDSREAGSWEATLTRFAESDPDLYAKSQEMPTEAINEVLASWKNLKEAYRSKDVSSFQKATESFIKTRNEASAQFKPGFPENSTVQLELTFNRTKPFRWAWVASLLASIFIGASLVARSRTEKLGRITYYIGMGGFVLALLLAIYGFYCRVAISGRPPVSNMYETIIWVAFMCSVFALVLEFIYRRGYIALAGALASTIGFVIADQLPAVFSPSIEPLNAVLRSSYWLIIHVLMIVSSYAALALAWGLGNLNIAMIVYAPQKKELIKTLSHFCYRAIQIGVILLFFGTMLGGMWADESWGRFWGWDPKEVWALIAFMFYIIPLHARYVGWIKDFGLAACSVVCFSSVVMAWYGVNFILGTGLHSYGFGDGNDLWVYWAGLINLSLVVHAGIRYTGHNRVQSSD